MQNSTPKSIWNSRYKKYKHYTHPHVDFTLKSYEYIKDIPNCRLLDIGCGDGRDSIFFAEKGIDVTAIDFAEEAIEQINADHSSINARVMDITEMKFPDDSFDVVYAHLTLHYFDDETTEKIIKNIYRMLKKDGYFFIKCKSVKDSLYGKGEKVGEDMYKSDHVRHFFSEEYMKEKLKNFEIVNLQSITRSYDDKTSSFVEAVAIKD
ncbi:class I SAM-dependent methyltransferase [Patescibacteria group bacterium]|nr:class I SAM-dependent methyltransferase [Patescibacteria group bacterium]MBU1123878.1 class I SAM-dependent methyltransferase [Patescibacteria group bacterium]MBU1910984.1 class I SAM-dependent methyltransferase [Patescibacteria group bacterium]